MARFNKGISAMIREESCGPCQEGNCSYCTYVEQMQELNSCWDHHDYVYVGPSCACYQQDEDRHWHGDYTQDRSWKELMESIEHPEEPTKQRPGDQRLPDGGGECVQDVAINALEAAIYQLQQSKKVGQERYGTVLRTFNGRRGIQDVLEEARDLFVYLTQVSLEVDATEAELKVAVIEALEQANHTLTSFYIADSATVTAVANVIVSRILSGIALREGKVQ